MPAIINTNVSSLNAQRNLNTSQSSLATSMQRLSSGLREPVPLHRRQFRPRTEKPTWHKRSTQTWCR